jgi:trk system potassium uptake protein TrkA
MFGVPRVVARVNNPKNTWLFDATWGVDTAVSAPAVLTQLLDSAIGVQEVVAMLRTGTHGVAVVEITLDDASPAVGRRPTELTLPEGAVVVAVVRADDVLVAGGSGPLAAGDELLAVTTLDAEPALRRALGGQPGGTHGPVI